MIGGCQTNVERCEIGLNGPQPGVTQSARSAVPVSWQRGQGPKGSTVVYRWIDTCSVTEELKAGGMDDVYEWWLISRAYVGGPPHS